ncbi:MAG: glycosyltransferase [Bacteroidales bacterium]|nr:glycosyltransferase [Bacteroidales bacterium]
MNILFLCNKSPWPAKEGGPMAMSQLIEGLAHQGNTVKVLAINSKKFSSGPNQVPEEYQHKIDIEWVDVDLSVKLIPAFLNLFSGNSYHVQRFISEEFKHRLFEILTRGSFDIVQLETIFMAPYVKLIRKNCTARIVLRSHNIEHLIWKRIYRQSNNPLKKFYLGHLYKTLKNYELNIIKQVHGLAPISDNDTSFFKRHTDIPVQTIPFGFEVLKGKHRTGKSENAVYHIGAMNWMPNVEGIKWFLNSVWPLLHQQHPEMKLYLAGRVMPQWMKKLNIANVEVVGEVEDANAFIENKSIGIAPLFSGSGIRIKIIESMAMGKALVSTPIGAEGIGVKNKEQIMLAETAKDFADAISFLYTHPNETKEMGTRAQEFIREKHNPDEIIEKLIGFYRQIL